jgi:hypothetical protein
MILSKEAETCLRAEAEAIETELADMRLKYIQAWHAEAGQLIERLQQIRVHVPVSAIAVDPGLLERFLSPRPGDVLQ